MEYTLENYQKEVKKIEDEKELKIRELMREFAIANNPYKKGDIITDHIGSIIMESFKIYRPSYNSLPSCVYYGIELKKDGTPRVRQEKRPLYQINIVK